MSQRYSYQVSESAQADRKFCATWPEAQALAKQLSNDQPHAVYIDVYDGNTEELANFWYTVTKGVLQKHGNFAKKGIAGYGRSGK